MAKIYFIEGSDYQGKTTLINNLTNKLTLLGKTVLTLKEPSGLIRTLLLGSEYNLHEQTRRLLFCANHIEVMKSIFDAIDKYDYIFIDRTAVISDFIYAVTEVEDCEKLNYSITNIYKYYSWVDEKYFNNFFSKNSNLILLNISHEEFLKRLDLRQNNTNDVIDSKSIEFKLSIFKLYEHVIEDLSENKNPAMSELFNNINIVKSDNPFYEILDIVTKEEK